MTPSSAPAGSDPTLTPSCSPFPLVPCFAILAGLTTLATLRTLLLPPRPGLASLPPATTLQAALMRAGLRPSALSGHPPIREAERSLSQEQVWRLENGQILRLRHGTVRRWEAFQLAAVTRGSPELALQRRRLATDGLGTSVAEGQLGGRNARQSCLVPGTPAPYPLGVTLERLSTLVSQRPNPPLKLISGLIGLRNIRTYDCVVISLQAVSNGNPSDANWSKLVSVLTPLLAVPSP